MREQKITKQRKMRRVARTRKKIEFSTKRTGTLRLSIFRSNKYLYAQIIDDRSAKTLVSRNDHNLSGKLSKIDRAAEVGKLVAQAAKEKKISSVVFDRGFYRYHGRVKKFAEAAREGGLQF